ncbi:MAG: sodium:proton antiporter NhaD [Saprospiraceae bacterium]|nr:sodium:proton antiporter NhaD [Saprospiraceae bacterium]MBK7911982.1 sodium:proton antiporter NhaD [Saprospiraceae bacterium]
MILAISLVFLIGYLLIIFEHKVKIDKAVSALLAGVICWILIALSPDSVTESGVDVSSILIHHFGEIASILFFLLGAMTIVELVDLHHGFDVISQWIKAKNKWTLLIIISIVTFFLSAVLDNLTTTIVMVSLIRKILSHQEDRFWFAGFIVIAANSGGAWSPIGDVTTTMLWIEHKVSTLQLIKFLIIPSILSIAIPIGIVRFNKRFQQNVELPEKPKELASLASKVFLFLGIGLLILVPIIKALTHLPPFIGMMGALAVIWLISELDLPSLYPPQKDFSKPTVRNALSRIEIPSILFFLGILLAISALEVIGQLKVLADFLNNYIQDTAVIALVLGILSAVIDNVPLVAGAIGMYDLPLDHHFWHELAFAAGTGGSILIIGSAAGVAAMGIEKISYQWYLKRISLLALIGYLTGWVWIYFAI